MSMNKLMQVDVSCAIRLFNPGLISHPAEIGQQVP